MKTFRLRDHYEPEFGEYIVGSRQTGRHTVYLVYGEAPAGEERPLAAEGHEEILLLLDGGALVSDGSGREVRLEPEQVVALEAGAKARLKALTDCRYLVAGGHPEPHGH